jgi:hypothetical protein
LKNVFLDMTIPPSVKIGVFFKKINK